MCACVPDDIGQQIMAAVEKSRAAAASDMPSESDALLVMFRAYQRLTELGFREATYCPSDGKIRELIEPGSTGIHRGYRDDNRRFWIMEAGDLWPSSPCLFRDLPNPSPASLTEEE
jgi:hypothetical protein